MSCVVNLRSFLPQFYVSISKITHTQTWLSFKKFTLVTGRQKTNRLYFSVNAQFYDSQVFTYHPASLCRGLAGSSSRDWVLCLGFLL